MPQCQYRDPVNSIELTANFATPKKVTDLEAWLRDACKALNARDQVPFSVERGRVKLLRGWVQSSVDVSDAFIKYQFVNADDRRVYLVIARKFDQYKR